MEAKDIPWLAWVQSHHVPESPCLRDLPGMLQHAKESPSQTQLMSHTDREHSNPRVPTALHICCTSGAFDLNAYSCYMLAYICQNCAFYFVELCLNKIFQTERCTLLCRGWSFWVILSTTVLDYIACPFPHSTMGKAKNMCLKSDN